MNPVTLAAPVGPLPLSEGVVADFSAETWWLTLVKAVFIVVFLIASVILVLWVERLRDRKSVV